MPDQLAAPTTRVGGLRELKKRQTRSDIAAAATDLVAQNGMDATTVEMIAERAVVSARTFFNYFESKAEAVLASTVDTFGILPELLETRPVNENPLVAIRETFCEFARTAALADGRDAQMRVILESNPELKAELDRAFSALGDQLTRQLVARYPADPGAPMAAAVAVNVGFGLLWLAYVDATKSPGSGLSPDRLREYFDVFVQYPFTA
jgi:AcrR family transcriptional regulator